MKYLVGLLSLVFSLAAVADTQVGTITTGKIQPKRVTSTGTVNIGSPVTTKEQCWEVNRNNAESRKASSDYLCDPLADRARITYTPPAPPPTQTTWKLCVADPGYCTVPAGTTIRFGVSPTTKYLDSPNRSGTVWCDISSFGGTATDPAPGEQKNCYIPDTGVVNPPPPPPPPPPPTGTAAGPRVTTFTPSGPIIAAAGQVISGLAISNPNGNCITVNVPNVVIRDVKFESCGRYAVLFNGNTAGSVLEHSVINDSGFGAYADNTSGVTIRKNVFNSLRRIGERYAHAVAVQYADNVLVEGNEFLGSFPNDVLSGYQASNIRYLNNLFDITQLDEPTGAAFTIGDSTTGNTGRDNYIAGNIVRRQVGGVPAGVFGSAGNTILEKNCLTAGIQAYNYSGVFVGVTVRNNVINLANSFVPDTSVIAGWSTNINSTDCSLVPK